MKTSFLLFLCIAAIFLPTASAAKKLKGAKQSKKTTDTIKEIPNEDRRKLHDGHGKFGNTHHKLLKGPKERSCTFDQKLQKPVYDDAFATGRVATKFGNSVSNSQKEKGRNAGKGGESQETKFSCASRGISEPTMARGIYIDPASLRDKINYKVKTDGKGIRVKVEYKQEFDEDWGVNDYTDTKTSFEIVFDSLVEYAKTDNNPYRSDSEQAFNWGDDIVVQSIDLTEWANFTSVFDDGLSSSFDVDSKSAMANFKFTIRKATLGEKVTANTMKIDVRIRNFPWLRDDTNLALTSTVKTEQKVEMTYNTAADVMYDRNGNIVEQAAKWTQNAFISFDQARDNIGFIPFGDYTWDDHAEATHTNATITPGTGTTMGDLFTALCTSSLLELARSMDPEATMPPECGNATLPPTADANQYVWEEKSSIRVVGTSPPASLYYGVETHQHIAYSFVGESAQHAADIYWDPEAGIGYEEKQEDPESAAASASSSGGTAASGFSSARSVVSVWTGLTMVGALMVLAN